MQQTQSRNIVQEQEIMWRFAGQIDNAQGQKRQLSQGGNRQR
jgi:hypothetical protein